MKPKKKLCVVLVTKKSSSHDEHRQAFRSYAQNSPYSGERVRFAYIYHDKQSEFVNSLKPGKVVSLYLYEGSSLFEFHDFLDWIPLLYKLEKCSYQHVPEST